jgi:hypothetical protein
MIQERVLAPKGEGPMKKKDSAEKAAQVETKNCLLAKAISSPEFFDDAQRTRIAPVGLKREPVVSAETTKPSTSEVVPVWYAARAQSRGPTTRMAKAIPIAFGEPVVEGFEFVGGAAPLVLVDPVVHSKGIEAPAREPVQAA